MSFYLKKRVAILLLEYLKFRNNASIIVILVKSLLKVRPTYNLLNQSVTIQLLGGIHIRKTPPWG